MDRNICNDRRVHAEWRSIWSSLGRDVIWKTHEIQNLVDPPIPLNMMCARFASNPRKNMNKKRKAARRNPRASTPKTRALIRLDTKKIRKNVLGRFKRSKATHASLNAEVEQFEKEELPAFQKWIHAQCKDLQEECNTLRNEYSALNNTLVLAEELCDFYPRRTEKECTDAAAHYIETNGDTPKGFEEFFRKPEHTFGSDPFSDFEDEETEAAFSEELKDARDFFDSLIDDFYEERSFPKPPSKREVKTREKSIKKTYRTIIRKLHPDRAGSSTPEQQELWHAAKHAYETDDLETLQHIESNCDLLNKKHLKIASISSIHAGLTFYKKANTQVRKKLRQLKKQYEWGFLSWSDRKKKSVSKAHTQELDRDVQWLRTHMVVGKAMLKRMQAAPKKRPPRPKKAKPENPSQTGFWF